MYKLNGFEISAIYSSENINYIKKAVDKLEKEISE